MIGGVHEDGILKASFSENEGDSQLNICSQFFKVIFDL